MFIIAGISPKVKLLEDTPRICPACGLAQAHLKRVDHYLSLFFIPILRVKKGDPFIMCDRCEAVAPESDLYSGPLPGPPAVQCQNCGRTLNRDFAYCPYCGAKVH